MGTDGLWVRGAAREECRLDIGEYSPLTRRANAHLQNRKRGRAAVRAANRL